MSDGVVARLKVVESRAETLEILRGQSAELRRRGATSLYLYGSAARDELGPGSDVDLYIDYDLQNVPSLFDLAALEIHLSALLGRSVDIGTRRGLHPRLRQEIEAESVKVI